MLSLFSDEISIHTSFILFKTIPKSLLNYTHHLHYTIRLFIHTLLLTSTFLFLYKHKLKLKLNKYKFITSIIFAFTFRICCDYLIYFIHTQYFFIHTTHTNFIIMLISLYTNYYLILITLLFGLYPKIPALFAYLYGIVGNKTFRNKSEIVLDVYVEYEQAKIIHFGNLVGVIYFMVGIVYFKIIQEIVLMYERKKIIIYSKK